MLRCSIEGSGLRIQLEISDEISLVKRLQRPLRAHSQIVKTLQPSESSFFSFLLSRSQLAPIFSIQNSVRVAGTLKRWHPWPCQKQPCTKIATRCFARTISGDPGRDLTCNLKRKPCENKRRRICISGLVSFCRIARIFARRCSALCTSTI